MFLKESGDWMFNDFFIFVGGIFLSIINFFKSIKFEKGENDINSSIFSKLNIQTQPQAPNKKETKLDDLRDTLLKYLINKKIIVVLIVVLTVFLITQPVELAGMLIITVLMLYFFVFYYPKIKQDRSYDDLNQELPYALRHMGVELKAGRGLHDAMITIKNADYGSLSSEFNRVLEEVNYGNSTEDSLISMSHRVKSDGLSRAVHQLIGTIRQDISFDMHIKLKEYSQKLNSFILIYTFLAILTPVIALIMLMAGSTVMGDIVSPDLLIVIYGVFFPLVVMFMGVFIKKLEPKI